MKQEKWLLCPVCGNKTRLKLREDTVLEKSAYDIQKLVEYRNIFKMGKNQHTIHL